MFIVLYGLNNLGKTTQAQLLVERLRREGYPAEYIKYPQYALEPFGPLINQYLRAGNPNGFSAREFQLLSVLNRTQFETTLQAKLKKGIAIVAEDYVGTGIAWGMGAGVEEQFLKTINRHLLPEQLAFFLHGERFAESIEKGHTHEQDLELMERVRRAHEKLAKEYNWIAIAANHSREVVHEKIWEKVQQKLV